MRYCADDQAVTTLSLTETLINYWGQAICVVVTWLAGAQLTPFCNISSPLQGERE